MIEIGKCESSTAQNVVITIRRPWWAFWRKNRAIEMPNAIVSFGDSIDENGHLSVEVDINGVLTRDDTENQSAE
jgi:hypothetical protein